MRNIGIFTFHTTVMIAVEVAHSDYEQQNVGLDIHY